MAREKLKIDYCCQALGGGNFPVNACLSMVRVGYSVSPLFFELISHQFACRQQRKWHPEIDTNSCGGEPHGGFGSNDRFFFSHQRHGTFGWVKKRWAAPILKEPLNPLFLHYDAVESTARETFSLYCLDRGLSIVLNLGTPLPGFVFLDVYPNDCVVFCCCEGAIGYQL